MYIHLCNPVSKRVFFHLHCRGYDDYDGRFGGRSGYREDHGSRGGRSGYSNDYGGGRSGYSADREKANLEDEYSHRLQVAHRRMEETSANSLRTLNECVHMGSDTAEELDRQAEALDRTERRLDEMHVGLDQSKRHMRQIKSPFGGIANYFARRKKVQEVTDPKLPKGASQAKQPSKGPASVPPPSMDGLRSTGNATVDRNCDEMSKALHQLHGMGELIGEQLDDSSSQIDRVQYKMDRTDVKIKGVNRDIRRQL